jgi:hypothetical protein
LKTKETIADRQTDEHKLLPENRKGGEVAVHSAFSVTAQRPALDSIDRLECAATSQHRKKPVLISPSIVRAILPSKDRLGRPPSLDSASDGSSEKTKPASNVQVSNVAFRSKNEESDVKTHPDFLDKT